MPKKSWADDANWQNLCAPIFKVVGTTCLPIAYDKRLLTMQFFLVDHLFSSLGLEAAVVAVLGANLAQENYIRTQSTPGEYELTPSPLTTDPVADATDATDETREIRDIMTFSVQGLIYKNYLH